MAILVAAGPGLFRDKMSAGVIGEGYQVAVADDAASALALARHRSFDLVVVDVEVAVAAAAELRRVGTMPILVVCSRPAPDAAVAAFEAGADDFLAHGDRPRELVARVRALLRRPSPAEAPPPSGTISVGDVSLDADRHMVTVAGVAVAFPLKEFHLLELLMTNAGRVLTRALLVERVWGPRQSANAKTLEVHIARIRARIESDPSRPSRILTVRGLGYRYQRPADRG